MNTSSSPSVAVTVSLPPMVLTPVMKRVSLPPTPLLMVTLPRDGERRAVYLEIVKPVAVGHQDAAIDGVRTGNEFRVAAAVAVADRQVADGDRWCHRSRNSSKPSPLVMLMAPLIVLLVAA